MKLIFNTRVVDKYNGKQYEVGEVIEVDDKRGAEILSSPYASRVDDEPVKATAKKTTRKAKKEE